MFVARVAGVGSRPESWALIDGDGVPVGPVDRYLRYLGDVGRSANTVKAYAHDLRDWFDFLDGAGLGWEEVRLEEVGRFAGWLRLPPAARLGLVVVLPTVTGHCSESTVNRKLSAVSAFYQHCARNGADVGGLLAAWQPMGRRGTAWKPFLHHISKGMPAPRPVIRMKTDRRLPRVLERGEVTAILGGCTRARDKLLFSVLAGTGMRIGEALGLRHEDWSVPECSVRVVRRVNDNRARAKSVISRTIPVSASLVRLYADYLHAEYGELDSDYVFVNLWGGSRGRPLTYAAVHDLVGRLRRDTGVDFEPHWFRHSYATGLLRAGTPVEVVSKLLGHASVSTTSGVYGHLSDADTRAALVRAGWLRAGETL